MSRITLYDITGVILAGGRGTRMGGADKGLLPLAGIPMIAHVIARLEEQTHTIIINANRHQDSYAVYGYPVVEDVGDEFAGPLTGILSAMLAAPTPYILTVPCDTPFLPNDLTRRMIETLSRSDSEICVAHDGTRMQPVFSLLPCNMADDLRQFLQQGKRRVAEWIASHDYVVADFSDQANAFQNINTPEERRLAEERLSSC